MTGVTRKEYRVWMAVLDHPGTWLDMQSLGKYADMTARQASTVVAHMSDPRLVREDAMVMFDGTGEDARLARQEVTMSCFGITESDLDRVRDALSDVGGVTISDISNETGYARQDVARMLRMMDDVCSVPAKAQTLYHRSRRGRRAACGGTARHADSGRFPPGAVPYEDGIGLVPFAVRSDVDGVGLVPGAAGLDVHGV